MRADINDDVDVAIVGYGPVGQALSALLGRAGHRVATFERHAECYPLPRAVRFDGEVMRMLQRLGIAEDIAAEAQPVLNYQWFGVDRELILDIDMSVPHPSGSAQSYVFYQPILEQALDQAGRAQDSVTVERGWTVEHVQQHDDYAQLSLRRADTTGAGLAESSTRTVRARYVIGADGANSIVRQCAGIERTDLGFAEHWLVVDIRPHDITAFEHLPKAAQHCDPRRPFSVVANGRSYRRWEFMLLPGEQPEAFANDPNLVWKLLEKHITPDEGVLVRHAVYEFRSLTAKTMRHGRILLAGDAAHLMPPFMGEGMCSGLRDAMNLSWKLDLVLRSAATDDLLDSYTVERAPQNEAAIAMSIQMGRVSCELDPALALERDAALRSGAAMPPPPLPDLPEGVRHQSDTDTVAGTYGVQGRFDGPHGTGWGDDVLGTGFAVLTARGDPSAVLGADRTDFLRSIGAGVGTLDARQPGCLRDSDGRFSDWLVDHNLEAVVIRPDGYTFGGVAQAGELPALIDDLRRRLSAFATSR
ncbi:bifunctional 3-(3-hydroxy-phenyl)propionate/3-hydroxycinnamic acid hydroxylase [Nocardia sp. CA-120079]|uniref:bifunctional 3-(3-hydroxy-phenyl)propionate/3-hydroxycinnamic acid hydroxylase MhpA n=1 Tax=Nocardia sp. CA-120079 TaxID=3239974 RepID=UPI003D95528A